MNAEITEDKIGKVRRQWLLCGLFATFGFPLLFTAFFGFKGLIDQAAQLLTHMIFELPLFIVLYLCAYRRHGNKILKAVLVLQGSALVFGTFAITFIYFFGTELLGHIPEVSSKLFVFFLSLLVNWCWFILGLKLHKINSEIQEKMDPNIRVRKDWWNATLICCIVYPIGNLVYYLYTAFDLWTPERLDDLSWFALLFWLQLDKIFANLYILLTIPLVYYFAYIKQGTCLFIWVLIGQSFFVIFKILISLLGFIYLAHIYSSMLVLTVLKIFMMLAYILMQTWWYIKSYQLIRMNKKMTGLMNSG